MIDCHAHLADESFANDLPAVLGRAASVGVETIVCVTEKLTEANRALELAKNHSCIEACVGLYPAYVNEEDVQKTCALVRTHRADIVGIGEVGLDYWIAKQEEQRSIQREVLKQLVALSLEVDCPLNVHSRSAGHHTIDLLRDAGARRVLMHAFDGKASHALRGVEAGFFFSIPPSVLHSKQKQKLVRAVPLTSLVLETDSPVLGPDREARNEPCNLVVSAKTVAEIKDVTIEAIMQETTKNAKRLFFGEQT